MFRAPWERCRTCGKILEKGNGYELKRIDEKMVRATIKCTNPRCKRHNKILIADIYTGPARG